MEHHLSYGINHTVLLAIRQKLTCPA